MDTRTTKMMVILSKIKIIGDKQPQPLRLVMNIIYGRPIIVATLQTRGWLILDNLCKLVEKQPCMLSQMFVTYIDFDLEMVKL